MISYIENPKESTKGAIRAINTKQIQQIYRIQDQHTKNQFYFYTLAMNILTRNARKQFHFKQHPK